MGIKDYTIAKGSLRAAGLQEQELQLICNRANYVEGFARGSYVDWITLARYDAKLALGFLPQTVGAAVLEGLEPDAFYDSFAAKWDAQYADLPQPDYNTTRAAIAESIILGVAETWEHVISIIRGLNARLESVDEKQQELEDALRKLLTGATVSVHIFN